MFVATKDFNTSYGGNKAGPMMGFEYEIQDNEFKDSTDELEVNVYDFYGTALRKHSKEYVSNEYGFLPSVYEIRHESLGFNMGFEMKSFVGNLQTHKRAWGRLVKGFKVDQREGSNHEGGIHINVSNIDEVYPEAFIHLMYNNEEVFRKASGRTRDSWDEYCLFHFGSEYGDNYADKSEHYHIFNKDKGYAYEFRMFKAEPELMVPALELTDAAVTMCRPFSGTHLNSYGDPFLTMEYMMKYLSSSSKYKQAHGVMKDALKETYG